MPAPGKPNVLHEVVDMFTRLRAELAGYPNFAHLLSSGEDGRPHAVAVSVVWDGDQLLLGAGRRSLANVAARRLVSVLWGAPSATDYSLIIDGEAAISGTGEHAQVRVTITRAVLHRPGAMLTPTASVCGSDCVPLFG